MFNYIEKVYCHVTITGAKGFLEGLTEGLAIYIDNDTRSILGKAEGMLHFSGPGKAEWF